MGHHRASGLLIVTPLLLLAACAGGTEEPAGGASSPPAASTPVAAGVAVSLTRTGGFAGVDDRVEIAADGTWTATGRTGGSRRGQLSVEDRASLVTLVTDPGLAAEAAGSSETGAPTRCADTFAYVVTVRAARVSFVDCPAGGDSPRVAAAIVELVRHAVWG
jgi:hypothetical protein